MTALDPRTANDLDRFLDGLVTGTPSAGEDRLDRGLRDAAMTLHAVTTGRRPIHPLARTAESSSIAGATTPGGRRRTTSVTRGHLGGFLRSRPMTVLATMVLVVAVAASGIVAFTRSADRQQTGGAADFQLLVFNRDNDGFRAIDPETLADLSLASPIASVAVASPVTGSEATRHTQWRFSADAWTLARIEQTITEKGTLVSQEISILDVRTGVERSHISLSPELHGSWFLLSADGSRLAVRLGGGFAIDPIPTGVTRNDPPKWNVYDTRTGLLLSTIDGSGDRDPLAIGSSWFDGDGHRFFRLAIDPNSTYPGPWPVQLVIHDTTSGAEIGRIDLPDVRVGYWPTDRSVDTTGCRFNAQGTPVADPSSEGRVWQSEDPGVALSPDGTTMAVVHPDGRGLTVVDLTTMRVERTVDVHGDNSEQATPVAYEAGNSHCASEIERATLATFSVDGTQLYTTGIDTTIDDNGASAVQSTGLSRVDVATGRVGARLAARANTLPLLLNGSSQSPDGRSLYVLLISPDNEHVTLQRLDAATFAVLASRRFDGTGPIVILGRPG